MKLIKLPLNKAWKAANDERAQLYNHKAWYSDSPDTFDKVYKEWERLTKLMRDEENKAGVNARKRYQLL